MRGKNNLNNPKSQSAIEFVILVVFMLAIFMIFFSIFSSYLINKQEQKNREAAENFASMVENEILTASSVKDGYSKEFSLPATIDGNPYNVTLLGNRELVINYSGYEYVAFLPDNVIGNLSKGINRISKAGGIVHIQPG